MTLMIYVISLALSFCLNSYDEACNLRTITYFYTDVSDEGQGIDYTITEVLTFENEDGSITRKETSWDVPFLDDADIRDWQNCVALIADCRGVSIKSYGDSSAVGIIPERRLEAYKDIMDNGYINDADSFDYATEDDLIRHQTKVINNFISFGLFYMSAKMLTQIFSYFTKPKKGV